MFNPFFNSAEGRVRAFFRIIAFVFLFILMMGVPTLLPYPLAEYLSQSLLILFLFYVFYTYLDQRNWQHAGLIINKTWIKECVAGIGIAGVSMGLIFFVQWQSNHLEVTGFGWERTFERGWFLAFLYFLVRMMSVGFYEELMARGYLIPNITEGFTFEKISPNRAVVIAILISSAIFGVLHAGNPNATITAILNIFLAGVMLAVPFVITGRLALPIGLHFSWNFFQGGIFGFRVSGIEVRSALFQIQQGGPEWWTGGAFGPEAGVIGILGILLVLGLSLLYLKWTGVKLEIAVPFRSTFSEIMATNPQKNK
ncbi:MAG: type II CAAX endopeptidase family protein [Gracilimonas sp.]|jgi:membrane protease YdiL (CAAX protease family)|nr:type II CAAX endopeptidase family protein [Gracilimonas sp.]